MRASRARRRAHSLLELMVAMVLTSLMLLCLQQLIAAAARYYNNSTLTMEMQQSLLAGCTRVANEVSESNYASMQADPGPPAGIVFITPRMRDGNVKIVNGKAQWQRLVCYYVDIVNGVPCLVFKDRDFPAASVPPYPAVPAGATVASFMADASRIHVVARNVTEFTVSDTTPLLLSMVASSPDNRYVIKVLSRVHPKN